MSNIQISINRRSIPVISTYLDWGCAQATLALAPAPRTLLDIGGNGRMSCFVPCQVTNANILQGIDGTNLPYKDRSFDVCTSVAVLEHVSDWKAFLKESIRVGTRGAVHWFPLGKVAREIEEYKDAAGHIHPCNIYEVEEVADYAATICTRYTLTPFMNVSEQLLLLVTVNRKLDVDATYELVRDRGSQEYGYLLSLIP